MKWRKRGDRWVGLVEWSPEVWASAKGDAEGEKPGKEEKTDHTD